MSPRELDGPAAELDRAVSFLYTHVPNEGYDMKLVAQDDPAVVAIMAAAAEEIRSLPDPLDMTDAGAATVLHMVQRHWGRLHPERMFRFRVELVPSLYVAHVIVEELEPGDLQ